MSHKERDVNRNAWNKVTEKLDFMKNVYKYRHEKLSDCCASSVTKNQGVGQVFHSSCPSCYSLHIAPFDEIYLRSKTLGFLDFFLRLCLLRDLRSKKITTLLLL